MNRKWDCGVSAKEMSDGDIASEISAFQMRWDELRTAISECGGASGSPGKWLYERWGELETERERRLILIAPEVEATP